MQTEKNMRRFELKGKPSQNEVRYDKIMIRTYTYIDEVFGGLKHQTKILKMKTCM
jgi:hypothetical protein